MVQAANKSQYLIMTPSDKGSRRLDFLGRKVFSVGLQFCIANYQALLAKYDFNNYSRLAAFQDKLFSQDREPSSSPC